MAQTLFLPAYAEILHPLHRQLQVLACHLSGWEVTATVADGIEFLYYDTLYKDGCPYSTMNTVRNALSTVVFLPGHSFGHNPLVTRFLKGLFESRPISPHYQEIYGTLMMCYIA